MSTPEPTEDQSTNPNEEENASEGKKETFVNKVIEWARNEISNDSEDERELSKIIEEHIQKLQDQSKFKDFKLLFLLDSINSIGSHHANYIYNALQNKEKGDTENKKDILLIIDSRGGSVESAYLISKTCRRLCKNKFIVGIPRRAKSAATLISLGADEIHMGLMSELGPIDPQIGNIPAFALSNALRVVAKLSDEFPGSSKMFSKYLKESLFLPQLGHLERICESAVQYADRLLRDNSKINDDEVSKLADHFVNHYKDHGFVIDCEEAQKCLGDETVKVTKDAYHLANKIYKDLDFVQLICNLAKKKQITFIGDAKNGTKLINQKQMSESDDNGKKK